MALGHIELIKDIAVSFGQMGFTAVSGHLTSEITPVL